MLLNVELHFVEWSECVFVLAGPSFVYLWSLFIFTILSLPHCPLIIHCPLALFPYLIVFHAFLYLSPLSPPPPRPHSAVMTWRRAPYCSAQIIIKHYDVVKFIGHWVLHSNRASRVIQQELEVGWGRSRASDRRQGKEEQMTRRTEDCRDGWNRSNRVMTLTKGELNEQWGKRERNRKVKVCLVKGKRSLAHLACISWFN